jgi:hypothetical protein
MRFYSLHVNGYGYVDGSLTGIFSAIVLKLILALTKHDIPDYYIIAIVASINFVAIVLLACSLLEQMVRYCSVSISKLKHLVCDIHIGPSLLIPCANI